MTDNTILVIGATGFTGKLVVEYLAAHPDRSTFKLQIGGRSLQKLTEVARSLKLDGDVAQVVVDVLDEKQVERAVLGATVVISTAGPFYKYGSHVVAACARHGRHYVDSTGEHWWIIDMIAKFDFLASKTGATILPACGYDSMPSDIGPYLSARYLRKLIDPSVRIGQSVTAHWAPTSASGGTLSTLLSAYEDVPRDILIKSSKPYALSPAKGVRPPRPQLIYNLPHLNFPKKIIGAFFPMSVVNTATVQRTWGLLKRQTHPEENLEYGDEFSYSEFMVTKNRLWALAVSFIIVSFSVLLTVFKPARWLFKKLAPGPGTGPSKEVRENSRFKAINVTSSVPSPGVPVRYVMTTIRGRGDVGYLLTSILLSESAISLLPANRKVLTKIGQTGGVLTTMSAIGYPLIERLEKSGRWIFESEEIVNGRGSGGFKKTQ